MWRCDNVGGLGEHVACHMLWFLRRPFFLSLFLGSLAPSPADRFWRSSAQWCAFWGSRCCHSPFRGSNPPETPIWGVYRLFGLTRKILKPAYYQNYCIDSKQTLHDTKDHQVLKYGPPKKSKMAAAASWKSQKSRYYSNGLTHRST